MLIRLTLLAALTLAPLGVAHADSVQPMHAQTINLGEVTGVAYYTVEHDGFHVVTTLVQGETGTPVRVVNVLAPGQSVVLSTPREVGVDPIEIEISRQADTLFVHKAVAATN
jgi:predicted aconitase